jgi:L-aspartate oxidase
MQRYLMNFSTADIPEKSADCLVIGSGVAGLQAAWTAARAGLSVLLVVRDTLTDSNTAKAQGGIAASFGPDDAPALHLQDTLIAGAGLTDEEIARITVTEGPEAIKVLIKHGAVFDRQADGSLALGREGCHSRFRIVHAKGDATGAEVSRALNVMAAQEPLITAIEHCYVTDLLTKAGRCYGAVAMHEGRKLCLRAKATVLATGGLGRLFLHTTNPEGATGSGVALAYRAGAEVMDMEFVQFHPTALALEGCPNFLISEAVRGAGAILRNMQGERFMPRYHAMAELAPRDIVARCIFREMQAAGTDHIYLDATGIVDAAKKFPMIARTCQEYGVDIAQAMIPIAPAAHYMMGGVRTDAMGRTNIAGLYACGEAACTGLQGANRLASNSLLEGLVFGRRAALAIKEQLPASDDGRGMVWTSQGLHSLEVDDAVKRTKDLQRIMSQYLGIRRDEKGIYAALSELEALEKRYDGWAASRYTMLDLRGRITAARLIAKAALRREESRGAHFRTDFPQQSEAWLHHETDCVWREDMLQAGKRPECKAYMSL